MQYTEWSMQYDLLGCDLDRDGGVGSVGSDGEVGIVEAGIGYSKSEQPRARHSKSEQDRASQIKSEQVIASQSKSEQARASQSKYTDYTD
jgi:hypothetical protein